MLIILAGARLIFHYRNGRKKQKNYRNWLAGARGFLSFGNGGGFTNGYKIKKNASGVEAFCVVPQGFEPWQAEPKSDVLPLHHGTMAFCCQKAGAKVQIFVCMDKFFVRKSFENTLIC